MTKKRAWLTDAQTAPLVRNNAQCTVNTPYKVQLQVRVGQSGQFTSVVNLRFDGVFPPALTLLEGDICYNFQPSETEMRISTQLDGHEINCNADHLSPFIEVCNNPSPCPPGLGGETGTTQKKP